MSKDLRFDFDVNKENRTITVTKEFAAPVDLVWDAWTKSELLDQWWAPKPYKATTKSMDFRDGGNWLYAMVGPENDQQWCRADFSGISQQKEFSVRDAFCDENGKINEDFPRSSWKNSFTSNADTTTVTNQITYDKVEDLEKYIEMGFKEGYTMGLGNLDELLEEIQEHAK